jgi:CheY-like chemotaxis protein
MTQESIKKARAGPQPAILVVEDEILIRVAIADHLEECGYRVFEAGSAAEAITVIEQSQIPLHVVFTDVRMPGEMNGWGLAKWIRQHHPEVAVIVASAERTEATHELCRALPFLHKPYDFATVVERVQALTESAA